MKFKDRLSLASFSEDAVSLIKKYNIAMEINHSCISEALNEESIETTIEEIRKDISESGGKALVLHGPFTEIVPASIDQRAVELGLTRLEEAYMVCKSLSINSMVVHSGYISQIYEKDWHKSKSVYFWKKFMEDKPEDFKIYIENVFEDEPYNLKEILDELDDSRIMACLDIGHCNVYKNSELSVVDWMKVLGKRLGHLHLHNNYGERDQHLSVLEGDIDIEQVIETLIEIDEDEKVTLTIESRRAEDSIEKILSY